MSTPSKKPSSGFDVDYSKLMGESVKGVIIFFKVLFKGLLPASKWVKENAISFHTWLSAGYEAQFRPTTTTHKTVFGVLVVVLVIALSPIVLSALIGYAFLNGAGAWPEDRH